MLTAKAQRSLSLYPIVEILSLPLLSVCLIPITSACSRLRRSLDGVCFVKNALRAIFHKTYSIFGAAKPREHPAREGEDFENQTCSQWEG